MNCRRYFIKNKVRVFLVAVAVVFLIGNILLNFLPGMKGKPCDPKFPSLHLDQIPTSAYDPGENLWEKPTLLNINPFVWIWLNETACAPDPNSPENTRILPILVHTAPSHFDARLAIRRSWGSLKNYKNWQIRFAFLLGEQDQVSNPEMNQQEFEAQQNRLNAEQHIFGDIVIGSFIDSYYNLTYKHLMGYKWVLNHCPNANFVLKIDDDMFIDIKKWLDWRTEELDLLREEPFTKISDLYCQTFEKPPPYREQDSKWYVSVDDWPEECYPDYCNGWAYAMTVDLVQKLYSVSTDLKFFWIDDLFVTGFLMEVVKKKFEWKPEMKHIEDNVTKNIALYRPMCDAADLTAKREFGVVADIPRGELFERDMMCMWNKTLYDSIHGYMN